jgi:hypothetical protein
MKYIKFDHNIIKCNIFYQIRNYYETINKSEKLITYLRENDFDKETFNNLISSQRKRNAFKSPPKSEFSYKLSIEFIDDLFIILTEITTFKDNNYIIEHVFYS